MSDSVDLKSKCVLWVDQGLFFGFAQRCARDFGRTLYYSPWQNAFPKSNSVLIGDGYDDVERVLWLFDAIQEADLICYDDKTEVLTENGWRLFKDVKRGEQVATLDASSCKLVYQEPTEFISYPFTGDLLSIQTCRVNFAVTPNHRMYVRKQKEVGFEVRQASEIFGKTHLEFSKVAKWEGDELEFFTIPECTATWNTTRSHKVRSWKIPHSRTWPEMKCPADAMLAIIGFYLAEGSLERRNGNRVCGVSLSQNESPILREFLAILRTTPLPFSVKKRKDGHIIIIINSTQVARFFQAFGEGVNKTVPKWIRRLSSRQLGILFDWYMKGDGVSSGYCCSTVSRTLADALHEIILKLGFSSSEKPLKGVWFKAPNGRTYLSRDGIKLNISRKYGTPRISGNRWKTVPYDGFVYCLTVPNGLLYVRRNGVPMWCGNCFPDVNFADLQVHLEKLGHRVWGSRRGEVIELNRMKGKKIMEAHGVRPSPAERVRGLPALRSYLKDHPDVHIKTSLFRGDFESFHSKTYRLSEPKLDELEHKLGEKKLIYEFIVEPHIDSLTEWGLDSFTIDGQWPDKTFVAREQKDVGAIGKVMNWADIPDFLRAPNEKLSPWFESQKYRGFFSSELLITEEKETYFIDACSRLPSPPNEVLQELHSNWSEILWYGAEGVMVQPKPIYQYGVIAMVHSSWSDTNWQAVEIAPEVRQWIKFRNPTLIQDRQYVVPQEVGLPEIAGLVGVGQTLDEAIKHLEKNAEGVEGYFVEIRMEAIPKLLEELPLCKELGIEL